MTLTALFTDGTTTTVSVDRWAVDASVETFMEMGAVMVGIKE